jgi:uncharacterized SAM-binding protein YcdF (DUF218 family)
LARIKIQRFSRSLLSVGMLLVGMLAGAFAVALFTAGDLYEYQDTWDGTRLPKVDSIVCLAGGRGRIATAGDLWLRYWEASPTSVPILYFSGLGHQVGFGDLGHQLRRGLQDVLTPERVVIENESENTEENAQFLVRHAKQKQWGSVLLVTSPYHMRRARLILEREARIQNLPLRVETYSVFQEPFEPGDWRTSLHGIRVTLTEYLKFLAFRFRTRI